MSLVTEKLNAGFRALPLVRSLQDYTRKAFRRDLIAGLTVGVILVPQGMAYALLAGLPPVYGLYASLFPTALYAIFGSSRQLSIGPVALCSLLVLAGLSGIAEPGSDKYIGLAIATGLFVGVVQMAFGAFKLGFFVNFLSHPVIKGFTAAAAVIICGSQLGHLLGIVIPNANHLDAIIRSVALQWYAIHIPTLILGFGTIALIIVMRTINASIPGPLIVVVLGILAVSILGLSDQVAVIGTIPRGLPGFRPPQFSLQDVRDVLPLVFLLTFVSMIESIAIAKAIEDRQNKFRLSPNQELIGLGVAKLVGAFFLSYPTSAGFSRTALNYKSGASSGVASLISVGVVALTLLFLTPLFSLLPKAVLAAIIVTAVVSLIDFQGIRRLWVTHRSDFYLMCLTFISTLFLGIIQGVLVGMILSLALMVYRSSRPHVTVLGRVPDTRQYRNISRFPEAIQADDILIMRFDAPLFFGNATYFRDVLEQSIDEKGQELSTIILDASAISDVDSSGLEILEDLIIKLANRDIRLMIAGAIGPLRDRLYRAHLMDRIGAANQFMDVHEAVLAAEGSSVRKTGHALQTNLKPW